MTSVKKTKKKVKPNDKAEIRANFRAKLYSKAKMLPVFNPVSWGTDAPPPVIVDLTYDPTNKTRVVLKDNTQVLDLLEMASVVVVDNLGYKPHLPGKVVTIHYGNSGLSHPRYKDGDIVAGVFNITAEQQMFNASAIGIFKNIGIPILVIGKPIEGLDDTIQSTTNSVHEFFRGVDILLHPSPRNSLVSSTWVLASMAAGIAVVSTYSYSLDILSLAFGIKMVDNVISEWKQAANELAGILHSAQERNEKYAQQLNEQGELALDRLKKLL